MYHRDTILFTFENETGFNWGSKVIIKTLMEFMKMIFRMLQEPTSQVISMLSGFFFMVFGYFIPIREIVHVMVFFFILDVIFGYWAAKKLRKEKFSVKIIWKHTLPRMAISFVLILSAFMWDSTFDQNVIATYKIIGWFISGVLLFSIAQNGYKITKWAVFPNIANLIGGKVKDRTGMDANIKNEKIFQDAEEYTSSSGDL